MDSRSLTNVLLFTIAISLLLIVFKLYNPELIGRAQAASGTPATMLGCHIPAGGVYPPSCSLNPIRIDSQGYLLVKQVQ